MKRLQDQSGAFFLRRTVGNILSEYIFKIIILIKHHSFVRRCNLGSVAFYGSLLERHISENKENYLIRRLSHKYPK